MANLIAILFLITAMGILIFNQKSNICGGYTASQNAQLATAYKNKADAFESLNVALTRETKAQRALLNAYRERLGIPPETTK